MTLFKNSIEHLETAGTPSARVEYTNGPIPITISIHAYGYLQLVRTHRPMLLFLQQRCKDLALHQAAFRDWIIKALKTRFPLVNRCCTGCGVTQRDYDTHLQNIVSIHKLGGKNLEHIRLSRGPCYEYLDDATQPSSWQMIKNDKHLRQLAGFVEKKKPGKPTASGPLSSESSLPQGRRGQTREKKIKARRPKSAAARFDELTIA